MRFLLLDRIDELKKGSHAIGTKCISLADDCFEHHFPGQPVYPGALTLESLAQLGGALLELTLREERDYSPRCVMSTVRAKFRGFVRPGDTLSLRAEIVSRHEDSALLRGSASRGEETVCEVELVYIFLRIDDARLERAREDYLEVLTRGARILP